MSRLQVGGLALIINDTEIENIGKTVNLIRYVDGDRRGLYSMVILYDHWEVYSNDGLMFPDGIVRNIAGLISSKNLMPLGDKQTQDELMKEKELGCN